MGAILLHIILLAHNQLRKFDEKKIKHVDCMWFCMCVYARKRVCLCAIMHMKRARAVIR